MGSALDDKLLLAWMTEDPLTLWVLAQDPVRKVREVVATRDCLPASVAGLLAADVSPAVRLELIRGEAKLPKVVLRGLENDVHPQVAVAASRFRRGKLSQEARDELADVRMLNRLLQTTAEDEATELSMELEMNPDPLNVFETRGAR